MQSDNFTEIKEEILCMAKIEKACKAQYSRAYMAEKLEELLTIVKDYFTWCCKYEVLTVGLIERYRKDFAAHDIYLNADVDRGYLLCDNAKVEAYGTATVSASGNAKVNASGNAKVEASGNAKVEASGNAKVEAYDTATVSASGNAKVALYGNTYCTSFNTIDCKLADNTLYRVISTNTVYFASEEMKFFKMS